MSIEMVLFSGSRDYRHESGTDEPMSEKLVELEEILRTVRDHGLLSNDALARELDLHSFDVRLALLDAASWGLIRRDRRRAWMLTHRGEALITAGDLGDSNDHGASPG
jgi:hypothetical protein